MNLIMSLITAFGSALFPNDAQEILGIWSGDGHQVEITSNGKIVVDKGTFSGTYKAKGQILSIRWSDGSRSTVTWVRADP